MRYMAEAVMPIAEGIKRLLAPGCRRIEIAGSLRRRRNAVKDIEIVAEPILKPVISLFGDILDYESALDPILARLAAQCTISRGDKQGARYKVFLVPDLGIKLDLFVVRPPAQWGTILAIRTGPAEFSRRLVTPRRNGGLLPSHLHIKDGAVRQNAAPHKIIETPTEEALFRLLEIDWIPPEERQ